MSTATTPAEGVAEGIRRRDAGIAAANKKNPYWLLLACYLFVQHLLKNRQGTTADIFYELNLPPDVEPRFLGSVGKKIVSLRIARPLAYVRSHRPESHARTLLLYQLSDVEAAKGFLLKTAELIGKQRPPPRKDETGQYYLPGLIDNDSQ